MTEKTDCKKTLDAYHATRDQFRIVDVPDLQYLMVDGHGDPNTSPAFTDAIEALYPVAYKRLDDVRLETLSEGRCVQTLHVGSFDDEGDVLARMHGEFIPGNDLRMAGTHHEVYLSDFRRVAPAKRRTILRQPVTS